MLHDQNTAILGALRCSLCNGTWFSVAGFERMTRARRKDGGGPSQWLTFRDSPTSVEATEPDVDCLECGESMKRLQGVITGRPSELIIDVCTAHGAWLDGGETESLIEFLLEVSKRPTLPDAMKPMSAQKLRLVARDRALLAGSVDNAIERDERTIAWGLLDIVGWALRIP